MAQKDNGNLKRGNLRPQPHGGALAPPPEGGRPENFVKAREARTALRERVGRDSDAAVEEIHQDLTSLTRKILRRAEREGKVPPRQTMDVVREFRQTTEAVNELRKARGALAEADEFFATLDARITEATSRMAEGPEPAVEVLT